MSGRGILACALACLLGFVFPACGTVEPSVSPDAGESVDSSVEESVPLPLCEVKAEIDAHYGDPVDASALYANLLLDRTYSVSRAWNKDYAGTEKTLSDGVVPGDFNHYAWVGIDVGQTDIVFDLEEVRTDIGGFRAVFLYIPDYAIQLPQYVEISVSEDGESYYTAATIYGPTDITVQSDVFDFNFRVARLLRARYIRFRVRANRGIVFLGELEARGYEGERDDSMDWTDVYPPFELPASEPVYSDGVAATEFNLALGQNVKVYPRAYSQVQKKYASESDNAQDTGRLHDGVTQRSPDWTSDGSFRMTRGDGRDLIFDLGYVASVSSFAADMLQMPSWGVQVCSRIGVSVSVDGKEWQTVAVMEEPSSAGSENAVVRFTASAGHPYMARFVRFSFLFRTHAAFSEIEIYGTEKIPSGALLPSADATDPDCPLPYAYPTEDVMGMKDVRNILCSYQSDTSYPCSDESALLDANDYLDLISYRKDGEIRDVLFDHLLLSPHNLFASGTDKEVLAGWTPYFDAHFSSGHGLEAISEAAEKLGKAIGDPDYREGVFLSVLRPALASGADQTFGDVDGDGKPEMRNVLDDRKKIIRWEVDMQLRRLAETSAPHVRMCGFYWHTESLVLTDPDEVELVQYATSYIHAKGYPVFWIPYYDAEGYERWKEMGFDFACLQPNYAFMSIDDPDRLETTALKAKLHGMAVEIELNTTQSPESARRYREYLEAGREYGYIGATKVYYLGGFPSDLLSARDSGSENIRRIYDDTYAYAKNKEPETVAPDEPSGADAPASLTLTGDAGRKLTGKIDFEPAEGVRPVLTEMPTYGTVRLLESGTVTYTPAKGFYGEDSFCVALKSGELTGPETRVAVAVNFVAP